MRVVILVFCALAAVSAEPLRSQRIVGGTETTIENYPEIVTLLFSNMDILFFHACSAILLNNRAVLTAGHCVNGDPVERWRMRVGTTFSTSGGALHFPNRIIMHPGFTSRLDNDVAIMHSSTAIVFNNAVRPASIAGPNYFLTDNQPVWAVGWGSDRVAGPNSSVLRHVQIYTVNQDICRQRYATVGRVVTDNMLCSGVLDVGGRDQCTGDSGSPLYHQGNVVGVCSFGERCGLPQFPGVNARVSRFTSWIVANA